MTTFRLHGANPEKLYESFGIPMPQKISDFSTNTNALEWNGEINTDIKKILCEYPDDESSALRSLIAAQNNYAEENILVTNGSNESIYIIASYFASGHNCIVQPVYGEYERALKSYGATPSNIFSADTIPNDADTVWLCNPCNPTGQFIKDNEMKNLFTAHKDKTFIVDEAYREFVFNEDAEAEHTIFNNVIFLRSLTKIYHLCGARIGYVAAPSDIIAKLKKRQPTWSVNSLAQSAAEAFLKDREFPKITRKFYKAEIPRFIRELRKCGCEITETSVNFFLIKCKNDEELISFLLKKGIVVRHTRNFPGLDGKYVRAAARTQEENDLFTAAMKEYNTQR